MMKKQICSIAVFALITSGHASLVWTGGGDGVSLFQEANWLDHNNAVPVANTINAGSVVTAATGGLIEINDGTGSPSNFGGNFDVGVGNDLDVGGGKILATSSGGLRVNGATDVANSTATISGASTVRVTFIVDFDVELSGASTLRLNGSGNPLNNGASVDILDTASKLLFDNETYTAFSTEHGGKVTYNGAALVFGTDAFVIEEGDNALATAYNGASGVQIQAIPEPAVLGLISLSGMAIILSRRLFSR